MEGFFDDLKDKIVTNGRVEEMRQIANENLFNFRSKENFSNQDYLLKSFQIFKGKNDKRLKGILRKKENELEAVIRVYDYIYWGEIKTRKTTIFEIYGPDLNLPQFYIHPKGILNQVSSFFMEKEIPYSDNSDFHGKFSIETPDSKTFEQAIDLNLLNELIKSPEISIEGEGDYLLVYFSGKQIPAKELIDFYENAIDLLEIIINNNSNEFV